MLRQSRIDESDYNGQEMTCKLSSRAVVAIIAGIAGAWIAAGSSGFLGHPLRHALTCLAMGVAVIAAWPWPDRAWKNWAILAAGIIAGFGS